MLLTRRMDFSASHRGDRGERHAHGHNYRLDVTLRGEVDPETGMVIDLKRLKDILESEVAARFDHRNLNEDTSYFRGTPATGENVATVVFGLLDSALPQDLLYRVRLQPTEDYWVEVTR